MNHESGIMNYESGI